jgi:hypothetical protein
MATYSSNVTLKVNAAVNATITFGINPPAGFTTIYTAPSNGYAIIQFIATGAIRIGNFQESISGSSIARYIGPGLSFQVQNITSASYSISGVEFVNSS